MDMVLVIVLQESDCRLQLYVSLFVHDYIYNMHPNIQHAPYLMPCIKPWLYHEGCC